MYAPNMINPKENDGFIQGEQALLKKAKAEHQKTPECTGKDCKICAEYDEKIKYGTRALNRAINVSDTEGLFTDYCLKYIESRKSMLSKQVYYTYKTNYMKIFRGFFDKKKLRLIDITEKEIKAFYDQERKRGIKEITLKKYNNVYNADHTHL